MSESRVIRGLRISFTSIESDAVADARHGKARDGY